ncbi:MAG: hypothetical protein R3A52_22670 [Polyangiales bacterium]
MPASAGNCDVAESCRLTASLPADARVATGAVCHAARGAATVQETCTGGTTCPADAFLPSSTVCRAAAGVCDVAESCSGTHSAACPADARSSAGTVCRASIGNCDVAETCNGTAVTCPTDAFLPSSTVCAWRRTLRHGRVVHRLTTTATTDARVTTGTVCRASAGNCDVAETCSGSR